MVVLMWRKKVNRFMGTLINIKVPDIFIDILNGLLPALVFWLQPFCLHLAPEAFHGGIVPAVPLSAHTTYKPVLLQERLILITAVCGATIRMQ